MAKEKVSFLAYKEVKEPVKVSFKKSTGEKVSFWANKTTVKPVEVVFYSKKRKK